MSEPLDQDDDDESLGMIGAFDPILAYEAAMHHLMAFADAVSAEPRVLPPAEVLRATQIGLDTVNVVIEMATSSAMRQILAGVDEEDWITHRMMYDAMRSDMSDLESTQYKMSLLTHVAPFIPVEAMIPDTPESLTKDDEEPKDQ